MSVNGDDDDAYAELVRRLVESETTGRTDPALHGELALGLARHGLETMRDAEDAREARYGSLVAVIGSMMHGGARTLDALETLRSLVDTLAVMVDGLSREVERLQAQVERQGGGS